MAFTLPELPYSKDALAPHISAETLEYHHGKHHKAYVDNLNKLIEGKPEANKSLEDIIMSAPEGGVFNNAAQVWNHTFYWSSMKPKGGGQPTGDLAAAITRDFGSSGRATGRYGVWRERVPLLRRATVARAAQRPEEARQSLARRCSSAATPAGPSASTTCGNVRHGVAGPTGNGDVGSGSHRPPIERDDQRYRPSERSRRSTKPTPELHPMPEALPHIEQPQPEPTNP